MRADDVERSRHRRHARARRRRRPASADVDDAARSAAATSLNVLAATAVALEFDVPLDAIVDARGAARARRRIAARSCGCAAASRSSTTPTTRARRRSTRALEVLGAATPRGAPGRGARRDARTRRVARRAARRVRPRRGRGRASTLLVAVGGAPRARAGRGRASPPAWPPSACATSRRATRRAAAAVAPLRAGDLVLVKGSRGIAHRRRGRSRSKAEWRLMLYHLLYPLHTAALGAERDALHHVPHGGGEPDGARASACCSGPWLIRKLREFQIGQVIRQEGPAVASRQGRHADDGRAADPDGGARADAAVGRSRPTSTSGSPCWRRPAFGAIGFADDYLKITRRSHHGLLPRYKMGAADRRRRSSSASC